MLELFGVDAETDTGVATGYEWAIMELMSRVSRPLHEDGIHERIETTLQFMLAPLNIGWVDLALGACTDHMLAQLFLEGVRWERDEHVCPFCKSTELRRSMNEWYGKIPPRYARGRVAWRWYCENCWATHNHNYGTVLYHSGRPYRDWCRALWIIAAMPEGFTRKDFQRTVGISGPHAHKMLERISTATTDDPLLGHWVPRFKRLDGRSCEAEARLRIVA